MTLCRNAALASLIVYLMIPPVHQIPPSTRYPNGTPSGRWVEGGWKDVAVPNLSEWQTIHSYDTVAKCEAARSGLALTVPKGVIEDPEDYVKISHLVVKDAQCIGSDDPRLKGE